MREIFMTKKEYMELSTAKEMLWALQSTPELRKDKDACMAFSQRAREEFEAQIRESFGSYDPHMHYDFNKKKT